MKKNRDQKLITKKEATINNLIKYILNIKRQIQLEGINKAPIIKLGRRLEQRSNEKLSKQILEHIITRYLIDNITFPTKNELIKLMINFLGNIQKNPDYYNLKNETIKTRRLKILSNQIGKGVNGIIYSFKPEGLKTKKTRKKLAYKQQQVCSPYNVDKHIVSALLLAYYDFQPKYYNKYFMEVGTYDNKSGQRSFKNVNIACFNSEKMLENNMKNYILHIFTNIGDQVHNYMERIINNELVKIDIKSFNSELKYSNIIAYLNYLDFYPESFRKKKNTIINELNKILRIKEEFLLDLILFRTERGCFNNIKKENVACHFEFLSSCYNVLKLTYKDDFKDIYNKYKDYCKNDHCVYNIPLSWVFLYFLKINIFTNLKYNDYIYMFKYKSKIIEEFAKKIRKGEIKIEKKNEIKIETEEKKEVKKEIKEDEIKKDEIKKEIKIVINKEIKEEEIIENIKDKKTNEDIENKSNDEIIINKIELNNNEKIYLENDNNHLSSNIYKNNKNKFEKNNINSTNKKTKIEPLDLEIINFDNLNCKSNKIKNIRNNNFIETEDITNRNINNINQKSKISCWFCCGADSIDVI